ncbi:Uncharacterized protein GBIM_13673 [Gryllus bimaculatus]|nr:Uncharacterized protein GBIM_13673 [Gryllus bimaculatus]
MESDNSVDGDFETDYENSEKLPENSTNRKCELKEGCEFQSDEETDHSSDESDSIELDAPKNDHNLTLQTNDGYISGSICKNELHELPSEHPKHPLKCRKTIDTESRNNESYNDKSNHSVTSVLEEELEVQIQKKDDTLDIPGHSDDLSCVSDVESNDGQSSIDMLHNDRNKDSGNSENIVSIGIRKVSEPVEEMEQLDFEAEEVQDKEEKEEGECEIRDEKSDEGELEGDGLEEGELTDEEENRPEETEPRPICRFYSRGQCTWGSSCRFVHPGVTDKGNYTMFDVVRPLLPVNGHPVYQPADYRVPYEKLPSMAMQYHSPVKEEPLIFESAWERGLRQAKEMMRKSNQRKETDMDFEEKKMNLSLGQEELDKENDYYIRSASPVYKEDERWNVDIDPYSYRDEMLTMEHYDDISDLYYHRSRGSGRDYWRRVHYETEPTRTIRLESEYVSFRRERTSSKYHGHHQHRQASQEFYEKYEKKSTRQKSHSTRIVTMEQSDKHRKEERYGESSLQSRRGDEWADPWMRSKSPVTRKSGGHVSRRRSHSSGSPHSSTGNSRSSSQSSHHSVSHSRSRMQSKKSSVSLSASHNVSSHTHRNPRKVLLPTPRSTEINSPLNVSSQKSSKHVGELRDFGRNKSVSSSFIQLEKKAANERALLMNPPAPSPQRQKEVQPHSPAMMRRSAQNPPPPVSPARSNSSVSSSGSDSSGSSSDSSESSCSSSSSSREPSPKVVYPPKRLIMEERGRLALAAETLKVKAMDALKLSGQKQQIKLTLKTSSSVQNKTRIESGLPDLPQLNLVRKDRVLPVLVGRKRPAENPVCIEAGIPSKMASLPKPAQKTVTSRREELLKQLKAVEDAIARKRSKI